MSKEDGGREKNEGEGGTGGVLFSDEATEFLLRHRRTERGSRFPLWRIGSITVVCTQSYDDLVEHLEQSEATDSSAP